MLPHVSTRKEKEQTFIIKWHPIQRKGEEKNQQLKAAHNHQREHIAPKLVESRPKWGTHREANAIGNFIDALNKKWKNINFACILCVGGIFDS
jgi:hypothetical protein